MQHALDLERLKATHLYQPSRSRPDPNFCTGRWSAAIDRLLAAGYSFHGCRFSDTGYLFRGMDSGLSTALASDRFGHFGGRHEMTMVEQAMGILFLTHEVSDLITVAGLRNPPSLDSGVLAIASAVFNRELDAGRAAVLAIGDGGIVFRYPFLSCELRGPDIAHILAPATTLEALGPLPEHWRPRLSRLDAGDTVSGHLERLGLTAAQPLPDPRGHPQA